MPLSLHNLYTLTQQPGHTWLTLSRLEVAGIEAGIEVADGGPRKYRALGIHRSHGKGSELPQGPEQRGIQWTLLGSVELRYGLSMHTTTPYMLPVLL